MTASKTLSSSLAQPNDPVLTLLVRAALFGALNYVLSLSLVWFVNVKPIFALLFVCAGVWGWQSAIVTAAIAMALWTFANPLGPAPLPVAAAQIAGAILCAIVSVIFIPMVRKSKTPLSLAIAGMCGVLATLIFYLSVNVIDALVNQPFWPWFVQGMLLSLLPIVLDMILFPLLVPVIKRIQKLRHGEQ